MARMSEQKRRAERRIRAVTRWLVVGSLAGTAAFGGLAATATHAARSGDVSSDGVQSRSSSDSTVAPSVSAPQQSSAPPIVSSGGS